MPFVVLLFTSKSRLWLFILELRVGIGNEKRVFLESLNFEIEMRVSQKSDICCLECCNFSRAIEPLEMGRFKRRPTDLDSKLCPFQFM